MAITNFTGTLNPNEIFGFIYNMIISQYVYADNVKGTYSSLVDKARVDGTLYGDTKLYYDVDVLQTHDWKNDMETNILELDRPSAPVCQKITLDTFRQIRLTVDNYLSKQAWSTEGAFRDFNSVMLKMIRDTKRIYDSTLYNTFIGTNETDIGEQSYDITAVAGQNDALTMAEALADLLVKLKDVSREYNDNEFLKSFDEGDLMVIWNAKHYNTLKKIDMPVIFHKDGLLNEFEQEVLPARYFGTVKGATTNNVVGDGQTIRSLVERDVQNGGGDASAVHVFPGDLIPVGYNIPENECYVVDDTIAFKVIHKRSVPYMSAFEVATSFFNPRSLTENNYLTFGHNSLEHLAGYPFITARFVEA